MSQVFSPTNGQPLLQRRQLSRLFRAITIDSSAIQAPRSPAIVPRSSGFANDIASNMVLRVLLAVLSLTLLFALVILLYLLVTRCRERRKARNYRESVCEVRAAREMKPHDVDLLYASQGLQSQMGSSMSHDRQATAPISPVSQRSKQLPFFTPSINPSRSFSISPTTTPAHYNTLGASFQPSERRPSLPVRIPERSFQPDLRRRPSSPTVGTNILLAHIIPKKGQKPALQVMIPNRVSNTKISNQEISISQLSHPQGRSPTKPNLPQKIFWSVSPAAAEAPLSASESEASTPSFGFQVTPPPLSPKSKPLLFPTHANLKAGSGVAPKQLKPSESTSALKQNKALEGCEAMKERSKSVTDHKLSTLISEIDALSIEQDRRRRIEGWLDTPGWGEGSVRSAGTGRQRQLSVITVNTDVTRNGIGKEI
jgi:hypothetical protein